MSYQDISKHNKNENSCTRYDLKVRTHYSSEELNMFRHVFAEVDADLHKTGYWVTSRHVPEYASIVRIDMASAILDAAANGERVPEALKNHALAVAQTHDAQRYADRAAEFTIPLNSRSSMKP